MEEPPTKRQLKRVREKLNAQVAKDPRWTSIFRMLEIRQENAKQVNDEDEWKHVETIKNFFTKLARENLEYERGLK